ncbi:TatD family hydrolase [Neisseria wadsworthii]|uniref:TatD family hydrolase n=1 Tax=Neisseria wadsworthii TaxID=607711 RepID=UPI000D2FB65F|nr:TatD family hydrolase [Neisseria wadsworthii]
MKFTDTHTHLADTQLYNQLQPVLQQAGNVGVWRFIVPSASVNDWNRVAQLRAHSVHCAFGIHPWFAKEADQVSLGKLDKLLQFHPHALIGEIGLDYANKKQAPESLNQQKNVFKQQLKLAMHHSRPVILHNVHAGNDLIRMIKETGFSQGGFAHAFSGSLEEANEFIKLGFKIGIGSLLLNPMAKKVRKTASGLPLESIVLETDSPFMLRNETNVPANVRRIAEIVAELRNIPLQTLSEQTEKNVDAILSFCR